MLNLERAWSLLVQKWVLEVCSLCCSVAKLRPTLCDPMDYSTPGFPVLHHLPALAQTHVYWVSDAIQPSHPLSPLSPSAFNLSHYQGLFQWVSSLHQAANEWWWKMEGCLKLDAKSEPQMRSVVAHNPRGATRELVDVWGACLRFVSAGCSCQSPAPLVFLGDKMAQKQTQNLQHGLPWWSSGCVHLPMQESQVQSLIQEDPTCCRAAKPVDHNYEPVLESLGARAIEPTCPGACVPQQEKPLQGEACAPQLESRSHTPVKTHTTKINK